MFNLRTKFTCNIYTKTPTFIYTEETLVMMISS